MAKAVRILIVFLIASCGQFSNNKSYDSQTSQATTFSDSLLLAVKQAGPEGLEFSRRSGAGNYVDCYRFFSNGRLRRIFVSTANQINYDWVGTYTASGSTLKLVRDGEPQATEWQFRFLEAENHQYTIFGQTVPHGELVEITTHTSNNCR